MDSQISPLVADTLINTTWYKSISSLRLQYNYSTHPETSAFMWYSYQSAG